MFYKVHSRISATHIDAAINLGIQISSKLIVTVQIVIEPSVSVDRNRRCYNQFATDPDPKIHRSTNLSNRNSGESSELYKTPNIFKIGPIAAKIQQKQYRLHRLAIYIDNHTGAFATFRRQRAAVLAAFENPFPMTVAL